MNPSSRSIAILLAGVWVWWDARSQGRNPVPYSR